MQKGVDYIGVGTGAMIFNRDGKVFLVKRGSNARNEAGKWDFPGGGVEFGEKCENAVKREIKEEFDMDIEVVELLEVVNHILPEERQHWVSPSYIANHISGEPKIMEPEKTEEIKWVDISEIDPNDLTLPSRFDLEVYKEKYLNKSSLSKEVFDKEIAICKKQFKNGKCAWGECDRCGVIPLLVKLHKGELLEDLNKIAEVKKTFS